MTTQVGFIGWRGMVGSVLMQRMEELGDFSNIDATFFTTSQTGQAAPRFAGTTKTLLDAHDISALSKMEIVLTCQGGDYTKRVYGELRSSGWNGYWIDAASTLRMNEDALIVLDPVNRKRIDAAIKAGTRNFIGGNCTVSLMLMGLGGLLEQGWVEWASSMTYQAASGSGAKAMRELVAQMATIGLAAKAQLDDPATAILDLDKTVNEAVACADYPTDQFGAPLGGSLIPWIDRKVEAGQTREEWKAHAETNKIMGFSPEIPFDGICVRVGAMRCHSQALTIKLKQDIPLNEIEDVIGKANEWVSVVPNDPEPTRAQLCPTKLSGTLNVPVGRLRKMNMGPQYLAAFTVGDQLLWGAAEPVRRMLGILLERR